MKSFDMMVPRSFFLSTVYCCEIISTDARINLRRRYPGKGGYAPRSG